MLALRMVSRAAPRTNSSRPLRSDPRGTENHRSPRTATIFLVTLSSDGREARLLSTLERYLREPACDPGWQPPCPAVEQLHDRGNDEAADHQGVEEDGHGQAEAELLQEPLRAEQEPAEDHDHDRRRGGDHPPGGGQALANG